MAVDAATSKARSAAELAKLQQVDAVTMRKIRAKTFADAKARKERDRRRRKMIVTQQKAASGK